MTTLNTPALCASLMSLAYSPITIADVRPLGMTWLDVTENGASYATLTGDGHRVFVVFRGSNDSQDLIWDMRFIKTEFPGGGRVHRGFHAAFMKVWPELELKLRTLDPRIPVIATGHSLGGAMVQQAAALMDIQEAHVFGCPRVGNQKFVDLIKCHGVRWEARFDMVTKVPFHWGPIQIVSALALGRLPSMFVQPWQSGLINSTGHSSVGYESAMTASQA